MALFIALILCLVLFIQVQMDILTAIRAYVGGEGLWAKAQKDAVHSIENYAVSHDEADYLAYRREIQVPLGDRSARIELQKDDPDMAVVLAGFVHGRNHPDDVEPAVRLFRRFQHNAYMSQVIEHWSMGDRLISELNGVAEALHGEVASGRNNPTAIRSYLNKLDDINRELTEEEFQFSSTLAAASRWAKDVSRNLTYAIALVFVVFGIALSWPIITRIRATENALLESEERYRSIFEHVDDIIYTIESDGTFSSISPSSERLLGWQPDEWIGGSYELIVHPDDLAHMRELFVNAQAGKPLPVFQVRILTKSGEYLDAEIAANPIHRGGAIAILGVVRDITERKQKEKEIHLLAATDSLTGIINRREFTSILENELARAKRYATPLSLVMYDLDHFKQVNDTFGHDAGDHVLQTVANLVKRSIRAIDVDARWGGEEFMILMPQSDIEGARNAAEKLRVAIAGQHFDKVGYITASFGVAEFGSGDDIGSLLKRVDDALYKAKGRGRNCVETVGDTFAGEVA
ncbi:MAG: diguanylate cyclase [Sideroxydans sp.]